MRRNVVAPGSHFLGSSPPCPARACVCQRRPCAAVEMFTFQTPLRWHKFSTFGRKQIRVHPKRFVKNKTKIKQNPPLTGLLTPRVPLRLARLHRNFERAGVEPLTLHQRLTDLSHLSLETTSRGRNFMLCPTTSAQLSHPAASLSPSLRTRRRATRPPSASLFTRAFGSGLETGDVQSFGRH